jgi:hypothetical protein
MVISAAQQAPTMRQGNDSDRVAVLFDDSGSEGGHRIPQLTKQLSPAEKSRHAQQLIVTIASQHGRSLRSIIIPDNPSAQLAEDVLITNLSEYC